MLQADKIAKRFGDVVAIRSISFMARPGEITALIGPNGAGKSTTFRLITGLLEPDAGAVIWKGAPAGTALCRESAGFLPEERGLYQDVRVDRLLLYWGRLRGMDKYSASKASQRWLDCFELADKKMQLVSSLSKGNQQKLQIAACLLHEPELLVLDEPFSGLDPINQELVSEVLKDQCRRGVTILISAHQLALVERLAHHVFVVDKGAIANTAELGQYAVPEESTRTRTVVVRFIGQDVFSETAKCRADKCVPVAKDRFRLTFLGLTLSELFERLAQLSSSPFVVDVQVEREDLHQAYVALVGSKESRRAYND